MRPSAIKTVSKAVQAKKRINRDYPSAYDSAGAARPPALQLHARDEGHQRVERLFPGRAPALVQPAQRLQRGLRVAAGIAPDGFRPLQHFQAGRLALWMPILVLYHRLQDLQHQLCERLLQNSAQYPSTFLQQCTCHHSHANTTMPLKGMNRMYCYHNNRRKVAPGALGGCAGPPAS